MLIRPILIAVFVLVAITFFQLYRGRAGGAVDRKGALPDQLDVLFYVLVAFLVELRHADLIALVLAAIYVATRVVPLFEMRDIAGRSVDLIGAIVLAAMWVIFAVEIIAII